MSSFLILALGLLLLTVGGDFLVDGASRIAKSLRVPPLVVGLTIVAFGTSAPELIVSIDAALIGAPELAVGNIVGSNIANSLVVIGLPAIAQPIIVKERGLRRNTLIMVVGSFIFFTFMLDGQIDTVDAWFLLAGLVVFLVTGAFIAREHRRPLADDDEVPEQVGMALPLIKALGGAIGLALGGQFTVDGALGVAELMNLRTSAVGLTLVALGTSLPELAAGIAAARRGHQTIGLGNVIGSNVFNILAIAGITAIIAPLPVPEGILNSDIYIMLAGTGLVALLVFLHRPIGRFAGLLLLLAYVVYMIEVLVFRVAS